MGKVYLSKYNNAWLKTGRGFMSRTSWYFLNALFLLNALNPSSKLKILILKLFGAKIGDGVVLKPRINVKYP